jgi:putative ABC transport system permease protein
LSGIIGIVITVLIIIPANEIIHQLAETNDINSSLPVMQGLILIVLSIVLTLVGGFIPAKKAAKQDPVKALRTE